MSNLLGAERRKLSGEETQVQYGNRRACALRFKPKPQGDRSRRADALPLALGVF